MKFIGYTVTTIIAAFITAVWSGYVFSVLWSWFIAGQFGLGDIGVANAIGLAIAIRLMTNQHKMDDVERKYSDVLVHGFSYGITAPLVALAYGYVVTLFI